MNHPIKLNDSTFDNEVLKSELPVIVDFGATWCSPCKIIDAYMEEIAVEFSGKAKVCTFLVDNNPEIPSTYGVRSNPTILFFKGGSVVNQIIGAVPKRKITDALTDII